MLNALLAGCFCGVDMTSSRFDPLANDEDEHVKGDPNGGIAAARAGECIVWLSMPCDAYRPFLWPRSTLVPDLKGLAGTMLVG